MSQIHLNKHAVVSGVCELHIILKHHETTRSFQGTWPSDISNPITLEKCHSLRRYRVLNLLTDPMSRELLMEVCPDLRGSGGVTLVLDQSAMMFSRLRSIWEELGIFVPCERPDDGDVT